MNFSPSNLFRFPPFGFRILLLVGACAAVVLPARAITVKIDYAYDTTQFFGVGNPSGPAAGQQARTTLEAAASYFTGILHDTFSPIQLPPVFQGSSGTATWHWSMIFSHPSGPGDITVQDAIIGVDEYRIYVGADSLGNNALAVGGHGVTSVPNPTMTGTFNISEQSQRNQIDGNFKNAAYKRGESTGFAAWGGAVSFDRDVDTVWNYSLTGPVAGANDFYSVAIHEMAHALGLGTSTEWGNLASGANFTGAVAAAAYGSPPPLTPPTAEDPNRSHWLSGTMSRVYGASIVQEAAMDPELTTGTRKRFTALDAGALIDIGWDVQPPIIHPADFNGDGIVDAIDFTAWKGAFGATLEANADGDADSDGADFLTWQRARGFSSPLAAPATAPIPEPATLVLLAWLSLLAATRRHQPPSREDRRGAAAPSV